MILRRLKVQGIRCFRNPVEIGAFGDGLNIIHAPNESGKSTLIEAVARALFDRYNVGGDKVEGLRPWGTKLAPEIELDFEARGKHYRLHKRLLSDACSELYEIEQGAPLRTAERDEADNFVRELMLAEATGRGATSNKHWGIARMLWCLQEPGDEAMLAVPDTVARQLQRALPGATLSRETPLSALLARLEARYGIHFTETGRRRAQSPIDLLAKRIETLEAQCRQAREAYQATEDAVQSLENLTQQQESLQGEKARYTDSIAEYQQAAVAVADLRRQVADLHSRVEQARLEYDRDKKNLDTCEGAEQAIGANRQELEQLLKQVDDITTDRKADEKLLAEARAEYEHAQQARQEADIKRTRGRRINEAKRLAEQETMLSTKLDEVTVLLETVQAEEQRLQGMLCPTKTDLDNVHTGQRRIEQLQAKLAAVGLTATVELDIEHAIELQDGKTQPVVQTGKVGESVTFQAGVSLGIHLPGIARIRIDSGAQEPAELEANLREAIAALQAIFSRYGVESETDLLKLQLDWQALEREVQAKRESAKQTLRPFKRVEETRQALADAARGLTEKCNTLGIPAAEVKQLPAADEAALNAVYENAAAEEERTRGRWQARQQQYEKVTADEQALRERQQRYENDIRQQETVITSTLGSIQCRTIDDLRNRTVECEAALRALTGQLTEQEGQLPAPEADPERLLATAQASLGEVTHNERGIEKQIDRQQYVIEQAQKEGRYERLAELEEELAARQAELRRLETEAQAVKLLRQLLRERQQQMVAGQLPELEIAVSRMLQAITLRPRTVVMSAGFTVKQVYDSRAEALHDMGDLSAGTREQLDLVARIALGEAYTREYGRTMMVLDDALLYTDPLRHDRVKEILKLAAQHLQIFILTSHPDRYRGIVLPEYQFDLVQLTTAVPEAVVL